MNKTISLIAALAIGGTMLATSSGATAHGVKHYGHWVDPSFEPQFLGLWCVEVAVAGASPARG